MPNKNDEILLLLLENNPHNICDFSVHVKFYKKASEVQNFTWISVFIRRRDLL